MKAEIHPTAKVHPSCVIYENVVIEENVEIGPLCIIGAPAEKKGSEYNAGVIIKKGAKLQGHNTVDSGSLTSTIIHEGVWMLKHAHVGHDAFIGKDTILSCGSKIGGHATIHKNCNIGLNASIHQYKEVPEGVMVGMNSCVTKKLQLKPFTIYAGVPAKEIKENTVLIQRLNDSRSSS